jgi:transcriptional regulator with XRE-family HTH domain
VSAPDPQRVIRDVGRRVSELRARRGWTQAEFAEKLEIALQNVQRIEQGRQNLTIKTLTSLAGVLACSVRDLFDEPATRATPRLGRPPTDRQAAETPSRRLRRSR